MPKQITLALVIAKPGHLWNGLQSLLRTVPKIEIIAEAQDPSVLLRTVPQIEIIAEAQDPSVLLKMDTEMHPELILIDASIFDETAWTAITKIKAEWPQTKFVVLTENEQQRQNAQDAGAEILLPKGFPAAKLVALIEDLLIQNTQGETLANSEGGTNAN